MSVTLDLHPISEVVSKIPLPTRAVKFSSEIKYTHRLSKPGDSHGVGTSVDGMLRRKSSASETDLKIRRLLSWVVTR